MNILIIPSWYTTPENPILGIFFKEQAIALQSYLNRYDSGSKVFVLAIESFSIRSLKLFFKRKSFSLQNENGIWTLRVRFLNFPKAEKFNLKRCGKFLARVVKIFQKKLNVNFDIVHIHSALNAGIWYFYSKLKIPYCLTEHASAYSRNLITNEQKCVLPKVLNNAAHVISVGNGLVKELKKYTYKNIDVIFNIVAPRFKIEESSSLQRKNKIFTFFSLGVNARKKGFDILLSSFQKFIESGRVAQLVIAGLNEEEKYWLLHLGISETALKYIKLNGIFDRESVSKNMNLCDCFILVSRHETFGVVFAEAMYCGKPVIASCTGGPDSFVNENNGILVPVEDINATANAMIKMYENYLFYKPVVIKKYAEDNFAPDVICAKLYIIYKNILPHSETRMTRGGTKI